MNQKITPPIALPELYQFGLTPPSGAYDLGYACSNGRSNIPGQSSPWINKWAKCKPVRNSKVAALTPAEFRNGQNGVYYGVRFASDPTIGRLHEVTHEYLPPRGAAYNEPYRISDFNGYYHLADINLKGYVGIHQWAANGLFFVDIYYHARPDADNNSIRIEDIVSNVNADGLGGWYPYVLIGSYCHILHNYSKSHIGVINADAVTTALVHNGEVQQYFFVPLDGCPEMVNVGLGTQKLVSVFLFNRNDLCNGWTIADGLVGYGNPLAVPDASGLTREFNDGLNHVAQIFAIIPSNDKMRVSLVCLTQESVGVSVEVRFFSGFSCTKYVTISPSYIGEVSFIPSDFGLINFGGDCNVEVLVRYENAVIDSRTQTITFE